MCNATCEGRPGRPTQWARAYHNYRSHDRGKRVQRGSRWRALSDPSDASDLILSPSSSYTPPIVGAPDYAGSITRPAMAFRPRRASSRVR